MQRLAQLAEAELSKVSPWHRRQRSRLYAVGKIELPKLACPEASGVALKIINTAKLLQLSRITSLWVGLRGDIFKLK